MFTNLLMTIRSMRKTGTPSSLPIHPRAATGTLQIARANCTQCRECVSHCPTQALTVSTRSAQASEGSGTVFHLRFHPGRCAACLRCVDACPAGGLRFTPLAAPFLLPGQPDEREVLK